MKTKLKQSISVILSLCMIISMFSISLLNISAEDLTTSDVFSYKLLSDETIEITGYSGTETNLVIPSVIDGYTVTSIGYEAFYKCTKLASVDIPDSVTSIGESAFNCCTGLINVTIGNGVEVIEGRAFYYCPKLTSLDIPDSVKNIGERAFYGCSNLVSVTIGNGVTSIEERAFYNCTSIESITFPESVNTIGNYAFYNCTSMRSAIVPENLSSIGSYAIGCKSANEPIDGFVIYGYTGSSAEMYAVYYSIPFKYLSNPPTDEPDGLPKKVLYLGNSLLKGFGKFGMSATDCTKDYYALLQKAFGWPKSDRIVCKDFEEQLSVAGAIDWMNSSINSRLSDDIDLIIIQLGDNVKDIHQEIYRKTLPILFDNLRAHCPNARILYIGSWYKPINKPIYEQCCLESEIEFVDICDLYGVGGSYIGMHYFYYDNYSKTYNIYDYSDDKENKIITIYYKVGNQSYQDEIHYESYSVISQEQITITGKEHVVDAPGIANHPSDFAFQRIAQRILYALGYSDEYDVEETSPSTELPTTEVPTTMVADEPTKPTFVPTTTPETEEPSSVESTTTPAPKIADLDGDGNITLADATMIQKAGIGMIKADPEIADVNGDGIISILDVTCVQKYLAGYKKGLGKLFTSE